MRIKLFTCSLAALALLPAFNGPFSSAFAQGTAFTYQGQLNNGANPLTGLYNFKFDTFNASTGGSVIGGPVTNTAVPVTNGLFTTIIDFGANVFTGATNWLRIQVTTNGGSVFIALTPRQELTPAPYAIFAEGANAAGLSGAIPAGGLSGIYSGTVTLSNEDNSFTGNGTGLANVDASLVGGLAASNFWQTAGNAGTSPGVNFLGTSDNEPLILRANNQMGLQLQYSSVSTGLPLITSQASINLIAGYWGNNVSSGVVGGTIAGGGDSSRVGLENFSSPNTVTASYGTVGGGTGNTAGNYSTVPGGLENVASGLYGFAAGQQAQALNQGAFVWADSQDLVFASTANDQFLIRAQGGVGIGTASPEQGLSVNSGMNLDQAGLNAGILNNGNTNGYGLSFGISSGEGIASQRQAASINGNNRYGLDFYTDFARRMSISQQGLVGIGVGTNKPTTTLEVNGAVRTDGNELYLVPSTTSYYNNDGLVWGNGGLPGINFGADSPWLAGYEGGALGGLNPNVVCLSWDATGDVDVATNLTVGNLLTVQGEYMEVDGLSPVYCYLGDDGSGNDVQIGSLKSGITAVSCYNEADKAYMHLYVSSITIEGGSDLAEPFKITQGKEGLPQGAVVVIDEENPGHLKLSNQRYDTHVAGVVSGANGINPGIQMQQQGLLEGGENVALTGRVYVQTDTSNGPVKPGDLLTTSSNPGYAMKVTDHARAAGAILGKAMTGLSNGKGMVLVLVTLQ